ncbi:desampylase [Halorientalis marina]|uniref:desampylase n=1 Tax=Halorientalis marina TaxID=2931976 RepID=UPI001FF161FF|nr:desampylase [Halorientalis marina]
MLTVDRAVYDELVAHAREGAPAEVCGVLGGTHDADESHATVARRAENAAATPRTRYELTPTEQFALMEGIEDEGLDVVGFYHSHPAGPPRPSETDAAQATWAGYAYVIVDLAGAEPVVGAWRWTGERFAREAVGVA